jgi:hypothetical protein
VSHFGSVLWHSIAKTASSIRARMDSYCVLGELNHIA